MPRPSITELEDALKEKDRRIDDLRKELGESESLISEMREQVEDADAMIEHWIECFEMVQNASGVWVFDEFIEKCDKLREEYIAQVRKWNKFVPLFNATVRKRNVGRPIAASEAQIADVLKLRKAGTSLRDIAEETSLGLRTVCTIVDGHAGRDRTTMKHLERVTPDRKEVLQWKARKRIRDQLPKRITQTLKTGKALIKAAKGLGRST